MSKSRLDLNGNGEDSPINAIPLVYDLVVEHNPDPNSINYLDEVMLLAGHVADRVSSTINRGVMEPEECDQALVDQLSQEGQGTRENILEFIGSDFNILRILQQENRLTSTLTADLIIFYAIHSYKRSHRIMQEVMLDIRSAKTRTNFVETGFNVDPLEVIELEEKIQQVMGRLTKPDFERVQLAYNSFIETNKLETIPPLY